MIANAVFLEVVEIYLSGTEGILDIVVSCRLHIVIMHHHTERLPRSFSLINAREKMHNVRSLRGEVTEDCSGFLRSN